MPDPKHEVHVHIVTPPHVHEMVTRLADCFFPVSKARDGMVQGNMEGRATLVDTMYKLIQAVQLDAARQARKQINDGRTAAAGAPGG